MWWIAKYFYDEVFEKFEFKQQSILLQIIIFSGLIKKNLKNYKRKLNEPDIKFYPIKEHKLNF